MPPEHVISATYDLYLCPLKKFEGPSVPRRNLSRDQFCLYTVLFLRLNYPITSESLSEVINKKIHYCYKFVKWQTLMPIDIKEPK